MSILGGLDISETAVPDIAPLAKIVTMKSLQQSKTGVTDI